MSSSWRGPTSFALTEIGDAEASVIEALVTKAAG